VEVRLALDTNRYTDFQRGDAAVVQVLEHASEIHVPVISLGELRGGFAYGSHRAENERKLREFLLRPGVSVLNVDEQTTLHYSVVFEQLRRQGTPIPTNDMWIAALALQHGLTLYARDKHFHHLPQLARL
jgi:tRNA(fMet)-specific endonuclease VapC